MLEIVAALYGLLTFMRNRVRFFWSDKVVVGEHARRIGVVLMAPLGLTFMAMMFFMLDAENADDLMNRVWDYALIEALLVIVAIIWAYRLYQRAPASGEAEKAKPAQAVPQPSAPRIMTLEEAAAYLRQTPADVIRLIDAGRLSASYVNGVYRIARIAIDDMLAEQANP